MAHLGEALSVIEKFGMTKIQHNLFGTVDTILVITGEGPFEAAINTSLIIPKYEFSKIINLGIAGSLTDDLKIGEVVKDRHISLSESVLF